MLLDDVAGIEAERVQDHADQDAQQDEPEQHGERRPAEEAADDGIRHRESPGVVIADIITN